MKKTIATLMLVMIIASLVALPVSAATTELVAVSPKIALFDKIEQALNDVYKEGLLIAEALLVVAALYFIVRSALSTNPQDRSKFKGWAIGCGIALFVALILPTIVSAIKDLASEY